MTHKRQDYRDAARAALTGAPEMAAYTSFPAWVQNVDIKALPAFTVLTPFERTSRSTARDVNRASDVVVIAKLLGGDDLEDLMDDLSAVIEREVLPALDDLCEYAVLAETDMKIDGAGEKRVATLTMRFEAVRYTAAGQPE